MSDTSPRGGRPPTGRVQKERGMLRLDDETFTRLQDFATETGLPRATIIRKAILAYLEQGDRDRRKALA